VVKVTVFGAKNKSLYLFLVKEKRRKRIVRTAHSELAMPKIGDLNTVLFCAALRAVPL